MTTKLDLSNVQRKKHSVQNNIQLKKQSNLSNAQQKKLSVKDNPAYIDHMIFIIRDYTKNWDQRYLGSWFCALGYVFNFIALGEGIQRTIAQYPHFFAVTWCLRVLGYLPFLVLWMILKYRSVRSLTLEFHQHIQLIKVTFPIAVFNFTSGYVWYLSLDGTSISDNIAIYNCILAFVFCLSVCFLRETITCPKMSAVILCLLGSSLIAYLGIHEASATNHTVIAYIWLIISIVISGSYQILCYLTESETTSIKDSVMNSILILGMIGFYSAFFFWPVFCLLHFAGIEKFSLPHQSEVFILVITCLIDGVLNAFCLICIKWSSPLFFSGISLITLPVSVMSDFMIHNRIPTIGETTGMICIGAGLSLLVYSQHKDKSTYRLVGQLDPQSAVFLDTLPINSLNNLDPPMGKRKK